MKKILSFGIVLLLIASMAFAATMTLRPNAAGTHKGMAAVGCSGGSSQYQCVDEVSANTTDYLYAKAWGRKSTYNFQDPGITFPSVNSLTAYYYVKEQNSARNKYHALIRSGSTDYQNSLKTAGSSYGLQSETYTVNPATSSAWTTNEIKNLDLGFANYDGSGAGVYMAQVYIVVDYGAPVCGDGQVQGSEVCDGSNLNGASCSTQGFTGGTLSCKSDCTGFVTTSCYQDTCTDTDGGFVPATKGIVSGSLGGATYSASDVCLGNYLQEYSCQYNTTQVSIVNCLLNGTGCSAGKCV